MKVTLVMAAVGLVTVLGVGAKRHSDPPFDPPEMVRVATGEIAFRPLGNFALSGKTRTPRVVQTTVPGFDIMKYQVTGAQYAACVADGACEGARLVAPDAPQTGVNWQDATAFAQWYSQQTGASWRLPSDVEWQLAAAERYGDSAPDPAAADPGAQMLASYENGATLRLKADPALYAAGTFGLNSNGLADVSGNIWEWTDGCMQTGTLTEDGRVAKTDPYCGVRIAGGVHRAAVIDFVRDASGGGCAVGLPPDHLGFRLVRGE